MTDTPLSDPTNAELAAWLDDAVTALRVRGPGATFLHLAATRLRSPQALGVDGGAVERAEKLAEEVWTYFKAPGRAGEGAGETAAWFRENKSLGGPQWLIKLFLSALGPVPTTASPQEGRQDAGEGATKHAASLRAIGAWLLRNDHDMAMGHEGVESLDPEDTAAFIERQTARVAVLEGALREIDAMPYYVEPVPAEWVGGLTSRYNMALDIAAAALSSTKGEAVGERKTEATAIENQRQLVGREMRLTLDELFSAIDAEGSAIISAIERPVGTTEESEGMAELMAFAYGIFGASSPEEVANILAQNHDVRMRCHRFIYERKPREEPYDAMMARLSPAPEGG